LRDWLLQQAPPMPNSIAPTETDKQNPIKAA